ncbi:MAG: hypothetical protein Q9225_004434 [Loekoesia sp. 1 TL-2023]
MLISVASVIFSLFGFVFSQRPPSKDYINATKFDQSQVALTVNVNSGQRNATEPFLYGWMGEDINHSIDGGLYGELIYNRAFQGSGVTTGRLDGSNRTAILQAENLQQLFGPTLQGWLPIGGATISLDRVHSLSEALPTVMQVKFPPNTLGEVGFLNLGFFGMSVRPQVYNASLYILAGGPFEGTNLTTLNVSLRSGSTQDVWVTSTIPVPHDSISDETWTQLSAQITNEANAPDSNNTFAVTFNGTEVAGKTFYFSLVSLFPPTFKNRPNGMRADLAEAIYELRPKFLRFPGGNNLEGISVADRFQWNRTIGPLTERPGRPGAWTYYNTDGFGLLEYLQWTEDMDMERLLAVYAGYSLDISGLEGVSLDQEQMADVLASALNELEYCMGSISTTYGALRAKHGHPEPFIINYVEIGNEDFYSGTYPRRLEYMYKGIKAAYPNIVIISTASEENVDYEIDLPQGSMYDLHDYHEPSFFLSNRFNFFDNWQQDTNNTDVTILVGEYSCLQVDEPTGIVNLTLSFADPAVDGLRFPGPSILSALAEAVYLIALERNPNLVKFSTFAPSLGNMNAFQWKPNLITFDADPEHTVRSVSYHLQKLFNSYRGTHTLQVSNTQGDFNPMFWVATIDEVRNAVYLKMVNTLNQSVPLRVDLHTAYHGVNGTIISDRNASRYNHLGEPNAVVPRSVDFSVNAGFGNGAFLWAVPAFSITVLEFRL